MSACLLSPDIPAKPPEHDDSWPTATNVTGLVIPDAGHWLMEEQPKATIAAVRTFLDTP